MSLCRVCTQLSFRPESTPPPPALVETGGVEYTEFWGPIRREGLFAGKATGLGAWISKGIRGIVISLVVHKHACCIDLQFFREERKERRDKALKLFPVAKYPRELRDTPKCDYVRFPVLHKGIKDPGHWPEIREKLTSLGADIYNTLSNSDVYFYCRIGLEQFQVFV